jgi:hypothetical protein
MNTESKHTVWLGLMTFTDGVAKVHKVFAVAEMTEDEAEEFIADNGCDYLIPALYEGRILNLAPTGA